MTSTITTLRENYSGGLVAVKSHGAHWGTGFQMSVGASTFENTKFAVRAAPAVEYSFFPYNQFTRRQLTLQYSVGVSSFRYREVTVFGRLQETRPTHTLVLGSFPSERSLECGEYYANRRNQFWPLLGAVLDFDPTAPYPERIDAVRQRGVALWDVVHSCRRAGR